MTSQPGLIDAPMELRRPPRREGATIGLSDDIRDETLVERALGGDRWAEEALYRRHVPAVTRKVILLLGRQAEAEDVVQDTFVTALERLGDLRDPSRVGPWLVQIAVREVHRRFRKWKLRRALGLLSDQPDAKLARLAKDDCSQEEHAELARLDEALEGLSPKYRSAWLLRHVEGHSLQEVAGLCGCSLATVKRWIATAEKAVRVRVCERERDDG